VKRIHTLDSLKLIAICAVFVIHYGIFRSFQGEYENGLYLGFNILARFAVPVFFVIAGYLFYQRTQTKALYSYSKDYLIKIFLMYLGWTFIYHMVFGLAVGVWNPINLASTLYYGTAGFEILWFLPALFYSILALAIAQKFNKTGLLFIVATLLHLIGLCNQSYQSLIPTSLLFIDINFRDPLFFGLFYVTLGHQLLAQQWQEKLFSISENASVWLMIVVVSAGLMLFEGLTLIQQFAGPIGEYYLFTPLLTISMLMVAVTIRNNRKNSFFSKLGTYSGEIYLNHGVLLFFYFILVAFLGYRSTPEQTSVIANSISYQLLLVPTMLVINFVLYLVLKKVITQLCSDKAIKQYKDIAMFSSGYWILFFAAGSAQGSKLFENPSAVVIAIAAMIFIVSYLALAKLICSLHKTTFTIKYNLLAALLLMLWWLGFAQCGGFGWLANLALQEGTPLARYFTMPFFCFTVLYLLITTSTIYCLGKIGKVQSEQAEG